VYTGLVHWSGHFDEILVGYFKIRTKSGQNDKNLSGQNLPSAEQASVRIIRGPTVVPFAMYASRLGDSFCQAFVNEPLVKLSFPGIGDKEVESVFVHGFS
jgi:hypothetical protein